MSSLLVSSLEHVATFGHLIAKVPDAYKHAPLATDMSVFSKTYLLEISDEEKIVRDELNQSIRADIAFLSQKLGDTSLEVRSDPSSPKQSLILLPSDQLDAVEHEGL